MTKNIHKISKYTPGVLQGTLQFEVAKPRVGLAHEFAIERHAISILSTMLVVLACSYLYFVANSIYSVIARADAEREMRSVETELANLEGQYLAVSNSVSSDMASAHGFEPVDSVSYVYRPGNTALATIAEGSL